MVMEKVSFHIFPRVLLIMLVVASVPMAGLWFISVYKAKQEWRHTVEENLGRATEALKNK